MKIRADVTPIRADITRDSLVGIVLEGWQGGDLAAEINRTLQQAGINFSIEQIIKICREKFQEVAEEVNTHYGDRYDDGGSSFKLSDDYEDENIFFYIEGKGYATRTRGMRGDSYLTPDDPDKVEYGVQRAMISVYPPSTAEDDTIVGEWDITPLMK